MRTSEAVNRYLGECAARGLARSTVAQYSWALRRLNAQCARLPKRGRDLLPVMADLALSLESRRDLLKCLRAFFGWCGRRYRWPDPVGELDPLPKRKRLPRVLTELEVDQVLGAALNRRDRALVLLVLDTGIRVGELAGLRWGDVGPDYLVVRGKTGDRRVPLSAEVKREILGLGEGAHVWTGRRGPLTRSGVMLAYRRLFARAGLSGTKLGPHLLRHTFATWYIRGGGGLAQLQGILGHASVATTMIYVTLAGRDLAADHARYSPVRTLGLISSG